MSFPTKIYLTRRSNGFYYIGHQDGGRIRWKSAATKNKSAALQLVSQSKVLPPPRQKLVSLESFIQEYLRHVEMMKAKGTLRITRGILKPFLQFIGNIPLPKITPLLVDRYKADRLAKVSPVTLNIELRTLRAAFNQAVRWQMREVNLFSKVRLASDRWPSPANSRRRSSRNNSQ